MVAYICEARRCLTWFIHSAGLGFKMEIPFETIIDAEFTNTAPGTGLASFVLSQPPLFFLEYVTSPASDGTTMRRWKTCPDWTEGHQASHVLRHDLIGSAVQLSQFLNNLRARARPDIPLRHSNTYQPVTTPPMDMPRPSPPMELPLPPMASLSDPNLVSPGYQYRGDATELPPSLTRRDVSRKRQMYSGAAMLNRSSDYLTSKDERSPPHSASSDGSFPQQPSYTAVTQQGAPASSSFGSNVYNDYPPEPRGVNGQPAPRDDYSSIQVPHSRSYTSMPTRPFYDETTHRLAQPYQPRRSQSSASLNDTNSYNQNAPSLPLLTTPYHPPPHILGSVSSGHSNDLGSVSPPILSGLPSIAVYDNHY